MKPAGIFQRVKAAGLVLAGRSLNQHELAHHFDRGGSAERPTRPYSQVVAVFACVRARAQAIAGMPLTVSTLDDQVLESGPVVELIERPNPRMTRRAFWEATSAIIDLFGSVLWVMELDTLGRPYQVVPVCPAQMEAVIDRRTGEVLSWKYRPAGAPSSFRVTLSVEQVHQVIDPDHENPHDPLQGLSPRKAVQLAINQYYKSDLANEASLDNGVEPGGVFTMDGTPTEPQISDVRSSLDERRGVRQRRRHLVLYGGLKWQTMGTSFKDAEFPELKRMARTDICSAYNVPPSVAGYYENDNRAHADAADRMFWANTVVPRGSRFAEEWDEAVLSKWEGDRSLRGQEARRRAVTFPQRCNRGYRAGKREAAGRGSALFSWFDSSTVPAIQRANLELVEQAKGWFEMGVPLNAILAATDAPFEEVKWGNDGYKPIGLEAYGTDTLGTINDPDGGSPESALLPETEPQGGDGSRSGPRGASAGADAVRATEATRAKLWALWRKSWAGLEKAARSRVEKHFFELRSEVLANLDRVASQIAPPGSDAQARGRVKFYPDKKRDLIGELLFDLGPAGDKLLATFRPLVRAAHQLGGEQSMREAADARGSDKPDQFNIRDPRLDALIRGRENKLRDVDNTLHRRLAGKIAESVDQGKSVNEIADVIRSEFNFAGKRAQVIARTEIGAAVEESRHVGREQAGVPLKSWLHSRKETGRPSHASTEHDTTANPIPNSEDFTISGTGVSCAHPRDSRLPAEHSISCGCTTLARYENDTIKAVMDRYLSRGFLTWESLQRRNLNTTTQGKDAEPCPSNPTD